MAVLKRVTRPSTFEKILGWVRDSRGDDAPVTMRGRYYVLLDENVHVAGVSLHRLAWHTTELRHLVVPPEFRRQGYGRSSVELVLHEVTTPLVVTTVRSDNRPCLSLIFQAGFKPLRLLSRETGTVALLTRDAPQADGIRGRTR